MSGLGNMKSLAMLPLLMLAGKVEWDDTKVTILRAVFAIVVTSVLGLSAYLKSKVQDQQNTGHGKKTILVAPEKPPSLFPSAEEEEKPVEYDETTYFAYELEQAGKLSKQFMASGFIVSLIHYFMGANPPLLMQSIMIPMTMFESPIFKIYVMGVDTEEKRLFGEKFPGEVSESKKKIKGAAAGTSNNAGGKGGSKSNKGRKNKKDDPVVEAAILKVWDDEKNADYKPLLDVIASNVNFRTKDDGYTALMVACGNPTSPLATSAVQELLDLGSNVTTQDSEGWTALHWCCFHGSLDALKLVVDHAKTKKVLGKLVPIKAKDDKTALMIAEEEAGENDARGKEIVTLLKSLSA